jgi:type II secretory pathway pseudopilin PulG
VAYLYSINIKRKAVMKNRSIIFAAALILTVIILPQVSYGQSKTQEEKEKELKLQQAIEAQKKAMAEQKKQIEITVKEAEKASEEALKEAEKADEVNHYIRAGRMRSTGNWDSFDQPYVLAPGSELSSMVFMGRPGDTERTTWDFSKSVKESTFSKQYSFDVEKSASSVVMSVMGDCKTGEIRVKIIMPGGKTYSDILLDESGNLNWRKNFSITETDNKDKAGEWVFKIYATKATGYFKISLQTF